MATEAAKAIEAILMVAQEPVDPHLLAQLLEVSPDRVTELCDELQAAYTRDDRGFVLVKVAGGYRFQSQGDMAPYVERFVLEGQTARLSAAALETLAIVAYKQPISRAQVAAIRGVNVDGVMRTLQQRGYIEEVGRDPGPGQATLFGTTTEFLERLGLDSTDDLPAIADLFPDASVLEALEKGLRVDPEPDGVGGDADSAPGEAGEAGEAGNAGEAGEAGEGEAGSDEADSDEADSVEATPPSPTPPEADGVTAVSGSPAASEPELPTWFRELEADDVDAGAGDVDADPGADAEDPPPSTDGGGGGEEQTPDGSV